MSSGYVLYGNVTLQGLSDKFADKTDLSI